MTAIAPVWTSADAVSPGASDKPALKARWEQWKASAQSSTDLEIRSFAEFAAQDPSVRACFTAVFGNSPYLSHNLIADPVLSRNLILDGPDQVVETCLADLSDLTRFGDESRAGLMARLRQAKTRVATAAALADIALNRPVMQITGWLADLATAALQASCCHLLHELHNRGKICLPDPSMPVQGSGLIVLGMGKLGAGELNFSSDVDVIILFQDDALGIEFGGQQRVFSQLARNLVTVMAKRTSDGYVFRTDLRLRPDPGSTPPAVSVARAARYYRTVGQTWERAAMIKARPVAGDLAAGNKFLEDTSGFVWRRNLDFPALSDIQAIKRQINTHKGSNTISVEGHNVKLGRGGIREIEFLTQTRQLIWGGQNIRLRGRGTLAMLNSLAAAARIPVTAAAELKSAYQFLRRVEHRLQMIDDQQTHSMPATPEGVAHVATFLGYRNENDFRDDLIGQLRIVEGHYNSMFERSPADDQDLSLDFSNPAARNQTIEALENLGFENGATVYGSVCSWLQGNIRASQTGRARNLLGEIVVPLVMAFAATSEPSRSFARFDDLLRRVSRGINLFSTIAAEPGLMSLLAEIMGAAPRLAEWLIQQPALLESMLQSDFVRLDPSLDGGLEPEFAEAARRGLVRLFYEREFRPKEMTEDLAAHVEAETEDQGDFQGLLDAQRRWARNRKFQIGIHMLRGDMTPANASRPLSGIAEACLVSLLSRIKSEFAAVHGNVKGGRLAIIAFGRLGSEEMTLSSDLDLIFVYSHAQDAPVSDGAKPLAPTQYYAKLCRRFLNGVTAPTAEGRLYEVDMRLRPSGKSGPIACSIERFESYQLNDAWTWEHQALTRARVIYAEGGLRRRLNSVIRSVLTKERDKTRLAADIREMRERIRDELEDADSQTIKHRRGGILDADFIAQFLQLSFAAEHPEILRRDACSVFAKAGEFGVIDPTAARELECDMLFWRNTQGIMLLTVKQDSIEVDAETILRRTFAGQGNNFVLSTFVDTMHATSRRIAARFDTLIH